MPPKGVGFPDPLSGTLNSAARDWKANSKQPSWLAFSTERLRTAERLLARPDLAASLEPTDRDYLRACQRLEAAGRRKARWAQTAILALLLGIIAGLVAFINQEFLKEQYQWRLVMGPSQVQKPSKAWAVLRSF
jgi:hypothetical protein